MKKFLCLFFVFIFALSLAACGRHKHDFDTAYLSDESHHWHECLGSKCGEKADYALHVDANEDFACDVCGYVMHTHTFNEEWTNDKDGHWHPCSDPKCGEKSDYAIHVDADEDFACDVCGYVMHTHTFSEEWSKDQTGHWYGATCEHSSLKNGFEKHTFDGGVIRTYPTEENEGLRVYTCTVCGYEKDETVEPTGYTISFDSKGGSAVASIVELYGTAIAEPENPEMDGYAFLGWYLDGEKFEFTTMPRQNITLTAKWNEKTLNNHFYNMTSIEIVWDASCSIPEGERTKMEQILTQAVKENQMQAYFSDQYTNNPNYNFIFLSMYSMTDCSLQTNLYSYRLNNDVYESFQISSFNDLVDPYNDSLFAEEMIIEASEDFMKISIVMTIPGYFTFYYKMDLIENGKKLDFVFFNDSKEWDEEPFELVFDENNNLLTSDLFILSGRTHIIEYMDNETSEYTTEAPSIPGQYNIRISIAGGDEWEDFIYVGKVTITKIDPNFSINLEAGALDKVYDGTVVEFKEKYVSIDERYDSTYNVVYYQFIEGTNMWSTLGSAPKDCGKYKMCVSTSSSSKYFEIAEAEYEFEITQRKLTISVQNFIGYVDSSLDYVAIYTFTVEDGVLEGETIILTTALGNVGETVQFTIDQLSLFSEIDNCSNYCIEFAEGIEYIEVEYKNKDE